MNKTQINKLISNLKKANLVTKSSVWTVEGEKDCYVRYVGIKTPDDWKDIFSMSDNLLLKFQIQKQTAFLDFLIANKTPFCNVTRKYLNPQDKWESILGEMKRKLKQDKREYLMHNYSVDNWFAKIKGHLKD